MQRWSTEILSLTPTGKKSHLAPIKVMGRAIINNNNNNNNKGNNAYFSSSLTYSLKELSKSSSTFTQKVYKSLNVITGRLNVLSKFIGLSNDF